FATNGGVMRYASDEFRSYTKADGLSANEVWSLFRDRTGTIWAGTEAGVCRFDGTAFSPFFIPRAEVDTPESRFNPSVVWSIIQDKDGNLWFGTDGEGARKYDGTTFTTYTTKNGLAGNNVRCIYADRRGRLWFGSDGEGVACYDGMSFRHFTTKDGLTGDRIFGVLEDNDGNIWFSTLGEGACRYDGTTFTPFQSAQGLTRSNVQSMLQDSDGTLWFGCSGGLFRLHESRFINVTKDGPWPKMRSNAEVSEHPKDAAPK
ncbi:MAG: hypothetical protein KC983_11415, partial [Phycisphaerales bacterium]|nr:hypothetical protein [Phycisphaerales bacterium]